MASKKFTQFDTANNTAEQEVSVGVKSGDNFKRANFLTATAAPTASNDGTEGYTVGSLWFNTVTGIMYVCSDSSTGAAVWSPQIPTPLTWTPVVTDVVGADTVDITAAIAQPPVGGVVACSLRCEVQLSTGETECEFNVSTPVNSDLTSASQAIASCSIEGIDTVAILRTVATNKLGFSITVPTAGDGVTVYFTIQYLVV